MPDGNGGQNVGLFAQMVSDGLGWLWFLMLAVWGGTVNYLSRIKRFKMSFSFAELFGEWVISGFVGVVTAYVCLHLGFDYYVTAAAVAISGHMGGRSVYMLEQFIAKKLGVQRPDDQ